MNIGARFGLLLIAPGVATFLMGRLIGGMWHFLIGMFLRYGAQTSCQGVIVRRMFDGKAVVRFMHSDAVRMPRDVTVENLAEDYIHRHHHKMFSVPDDGTQLGFVSLKGLLGFHSLTIPFEEDVPQSPTLMQGGNC